jgi:hypothetical protein
MKTTDDRDDVLNALQLAAMAMLLPWTWATLTTWLAQATGMRFSLYALLTCLGGAALVMLSPRMAGKPRLPTPKTVALVVTLALIAGLSTLAFNRPDADDYNYLPNAAYFVAHPDAAMGFRVHYLHSPTHALHSFAWGTSTPFEYAQAAVASVTGLDFLDVYYHITPALIGATTFLALLAITLSFVRRPHSAIVATLLALVAVCLIHDTHRAIGNLYLSRAFQGKFAFIATALPFYMHFSLRYFETRSPRILALLAAIAIASLGMTASALFVLIFASLVMSIVFVAAFRSGDAARDVRTLFLQQLPLVPLLAYGLVYKVFFGDSLGANSLANTTWPRTVAGHLDFYFENGFSMSLAVYGLSWILALLLLKGTARRTLLIMGLAPMAVVLNPWIGDRAIALLHLENIFWRLFYILPFPATIAIVFANAHAFLADRSSKIVRTSIDTAALALSAAMLVAVVPMSRGLFNQPFRHKLPESGFPSLDRAMAGTFGGVVLAPHPLSGLIAVRAPNASSIAVKTDVERVLLNEVGMLDDANARIAAAQFLVAGDPSLTRDFQTIVARYRPAHIVVAMPALARVEAALAASGSAYCIALRDEGHVLLSRSMPCLPSAAQPTVSASE